MKKIISMLLIFILIFSLLCVSVPVFADNGAEEEEIETYVLKESDVTSYEPYSNSKTDYITIKGIKLPHVLDAEWVKGTGFVAENGEIFEDSGALYEKYSAMKDYRLVIPNELFGKKVGAFNPKSSISPTFMLPKEIVYPETLLIGVVSNDILYTNDHVRKVTYPLTCNLDYGSNDYLDGYTGIETLVYSQGEGEPYRYSKKYLKTTYTDGSHTVVDDFNGYNGQDFPQKVIDGVLHDYKKDYCHCINLYNAAWRLKTLKNVEFEEGVTNIPKGMLCNSKFSSIKFPSTLKSIGKTPSDLSLEYSSDCPPAFYNMKNLEEVTFPSSLEYIENYAFEDTPVAKVTFEGAVLEHIGRDALTSAYDINFLDKSRIYEYLNGKKLSPYVKDTIDNVEHYINIKEWGSNSLAGTKERFINAYQGFINQEIESTTSSNYDVLLGPDSGYVYELQADEAKPLSEREITDASTYAERRVQNHPDNVRPYIAYIINPDTEYHGIDRITANYNFKAKVYNDTTNKLTYRYPIRLSELRYDAREGQLEDENDSQPTYYWQYENVDNSVTAKKSGSFFEGWEDEDDNTYYGVNDFVIEKNTRLGALYSSLATVNHGTLNYNANGGNGDMPTQSVSLNLPVVDLIENGFERNGYTFIGWANEANASSPDYTDKQQGVNLGLSQEKKTTTLYAVWQKEPSDKVSDEDTVYTDELANDEEFDEETQEEDEQLIDIEDDVEIPTEPITKKSSPKPKIYKVVTECDEGGETEGDGEYPENTTVIVIARPDDGYRFKGWFKAGKKISNKTKFSFKIGEDVKLFARFEKIPTKTPNKIIKSPKTGNEFNIILAIVPFLIGVALLYFATRKRNSKTDKV